MQVSESASLKMQVHVCSQTLLKAEQLACFAQTFTMALELLHRCCLRNQNDGAAGGNLQIKGR